MTTIATARPLTVDDLIGQRVLAWDWPSAVLYAGESDPTSGATMMIGVRTEIDCPFSQVAPADAPLADAKDERIEVTKAARGYYPTWKGPWRLTVDGASGGFHKTKRDAVETAQRQLAISDWHAANAPA